jgi:type I restriction enzyme R subunit
MVTMRKIDPAYEVYLGLYQAITDPDEADKIFKTVSREFFDMIVIDECHRGSAADDSAWREILDYFSGAIQVGLTATPKETEYVSNITYFGEPVYTYSLKQGIEDGFLVPYKVVRIDIDRDVDGWIPPLGMKDDLGQEIEQREYNQKDMDRILVLNERTKLVARRVM